MELLEFIRLLSSQQLEEFAVSVGTTVPHLRNVAYKQRVASAALAAQIQVHSQGRVQVSTLRPKDWHLVWGQGVNQTMNPDGIVADAAAGALGGGPESELRGASDGLHVASKAVRHAA